jgi:glycosyltransferase involved in cell wall biosynthesis
VIKKVKNEMKNSLVSILIPLYNAEDYIAETLQSCLSQTYENIEIIVVDDGSTDRSLSIAKLYEEKYPAIKVYSQKNSGAPRARNFAFEKSEGAYIQYLDADDLMTENKIASQIEQVKQYGDTSIYSCRFEHFVKSPGDRGGRVQRSVDRSFDSGLDWIVQSWIDGWMGVVMSWLTPRYLIEKAGPWNESVKKNQDGEFFARVLLLAQKVVFVPQPVVFYRITGESSVASQVSKQAIASMFETYQLYEKHTQGISHPELNKALAYNYLNFIRSHYPHHPLLLRKAGDAIRRLGFTYYTLPLRGKLEIISRLIGSENVIKLLYFFKKIFGKV